MDVNAKPLFWNWKNRQNIITFVNQSDFIANLDPNSHSISNFNFENSSLNYIKSGKNKFDEVIFNNGSFNKTTIQKITFRRCKFINCYFVGTKIVDCIFHNCEFINCNTYRFTLENTYINPNYFKNCVKEKQNANVAVETFEKLMKNARQIQQPDYMESADFYFRKWQRFNLKHKFKKGDINCFIFLWRYFTNLVYEKTIGYGYSVGNFVIFFISSFIGLTWWNYNHWYWYKLSLDKHLIYNDSLYKASYLTFRNITAYDLAGYYSESNFGLINSMVQGLFGFVLLGMLVSLFTKKIIR